MIPEVIIPHVLPREVRPQETREEFLRRWHEDYNAGRETIKPPENIRFIHDDLWKEHPLSIEFIRAVQHGEASLTRPATWFWLGIGGLFALAQSTWILWFMR